MTMILDDSTHERATEFAPDGHSTEDAKTGATIGAAGGFAVGAAAGSMVGPAGALIGGVVGGVAGAIGSGAAVDAIHRSEMAHQHDHEDEMIERDSRDSRVDLNAPVDLINPLP